jgi:hypothetical protein
MQSDEINEWAAAVDKWVRSIRLGYKNDSSFRDFDRPTIQDSGR